MNGGETGGAINSTTSTGGGGRGGSVALRDTPSLRLVPSTAPEVKLVVVRRVPGWRVFGLWSAVYVGRQRKGGGRGDTSVGSAGGVVVVRGQYCISARLGSSAELFSRDRRLLPTRSGASRSEGD